VEYNLQPVISIFFLFAEKAKPEVEMLHLMFKKKCCILYKRNYTEFIKLPVYHQGGIGMTHHMSSSPKAIQQCE
jgi:hypothetical protein